jgi:hypothetical protein
MSAGYQRLRNPINEGNSLSLFKGSAADAEGGGDTAETSREPAPLARGRLEPAPIQVFEEDETLARLLRAVESANLAFSMETLNTAETVVRESAPVEPPKNPSIVDKPATLLSEQLPIDRIPKATMPAVSLSGPVPPPQIEPARSQDDIRHADLKFPPWISDSSHGLIPLLSVSEGLHLHEAMENPSLSLGPAPPAEGETIECRFEDSLFKPPAPLEEERIHARLVDRVGKSMAWILDKPVKETKQEPLDPRQSERLSNPPLIAHYWTGGPPRAHKIADLSSTGLYLLTNDRWTPGTRILITLQRTDEERNPRDRGLAVEFMILRWGRDGLGGVFIPSVPGISFNPAGVNLKGASKAVLEAFVERMREFRQDLTGVTVRSLPDTATSR